MEGGRPFDIKPAGMLALDVARVEAGLLLIDVDFFSSKKALIDAQKYSPFEMGLGRLVSLDKGRFVGQQALARRARGAARAGRSSASRSTGPQSRRSTKRSACRRRSARPRRASRCRSIAGGRQVGQGDVDDVVAGAEEDDRARDGRSAALRRRHDARDRDDRRSRAPPRRRHGREDAVLQSAAEDGDAASCRPTAGLARLTARRPKP